MHTDDNSRNARDTALLWPYLLATLLVLGFFLFLFFAFSGRVALTDPVVAGLVGAAIAQTSNIVTVVVTHYYAKGKLTDKKEPSHER